MRREVVRWRRTSIRTHVSFLRWEFWFRAFCSLNHVRELHGHRVGWSTLEEGKFLRFCLYLGPYTNTTIVAACGKHKGVVVSVIPSETCHVATVRVASNKVH